MARLLPGENDKIDNINRLVSLSHSMNIEESKKALDSLLTIFKPMILKLCKKWSDYFRDSTHNLIRWDVLIGDADYWFIYYTNNKYIIDGSATYNKFIKDHLDQRIRYIYETELKYAKHHIFPDPNKNNAQDGGGNEDMLEEVINKYSTSTIDHDMDNSMIHQESADSRRALCDEIIFLMNDRKYFTEREYQIFTKCIVDGETHENMSVILNISRTRVSQITAKIKKKIFDLLDDNLMGWEEMK